MPDYLVSRIPMPLDNRVPAESAQAAAELGAQYLTPEVIDGTMTLPIYVLEIGSEPQEFSITVTASVQRTSAAN